jgi:hypothetical protein
MEVQIMTGDIEEELVMKFDSNGMTVVAQNGVSKMTVHVDKRELPRVLEAMEWSNVR